MRRRIGEILVGGKAISAELRDRALAQQVRLRGRFCTNLLELGGVREDLLLRALAVQHGVATCPATDLDEIRPDILRLVPGKLAANLFVVPFQRLGRNLSLAMRDPKDLPALDEISFLTGLAISPFVALDVRIQIALAKHYGIARRRPLLGPRREDRRRRRHGRRPAAEDADGPSSAPPPPAPAGLPRCPAAGARSRRRARRRRPASPGRVETSRRSRRRRPRAPPRSAVAPPDRDRARRARGAKPAPPPTLPPRPPAPTSAVGGEEVAPLVDEEAPADLVASLSRAESRDDIAAAVLREAVTAPAARPPSSSRSPTASSAGPRFPSRPRGSAPSPIAFSEPSLFASLRNTDGFYVGPCPDLPGNRRILEALGATRSRPSSPRSRCRSRGRASSSSSARRGRARPRRRRWS